MSQIRAAMLPEVIELDRFRLRPFRITDVDAVFRYANDEDYLRYLPIAKPYRISDAADFLAKHLLLDRECNPSWAIERDEAPAGGLNIRFFSEHRVSEIGYAVARLLWGRGIATAACRSVIASSFQCYPQLERVRARADARNVASIRVMEKLGMKREGLLRSDRLCRGQLTDEVIYGLLRAEWSP